MKAAQFALALMLLAALAISAGPHPVMAQTATPPSDHWLVEWDGTSVSACNNGGNWCDAMVAKSPVCGATGHMVASYIDISHSPSNSQVYLYERFYSASGYTGINTLKPGPSPFTNFTSQRVCVKHSNESTLLSGCSDTPITLTANTSADVLDVLIQPNGDGGGQSVTVSKIGAECVGQRYTPTPTTAVTATPAITATPSPAGGGSIKSTVVAIDNFGPGFHGDKLFSPPAGIDHPLGFVFGASSANECSDPEGGYHTTANGTATFAVGRYYDVQGMWLSQGYTQFTYPVTNIQVRDAMLADGVTSLTYLGPNNWVSAFPDPYTWHVESWGGGTSCVGQGFYVRYYYWDDTPGTANLLKDPGMEQWERSDYWLMTQTGQWGPKAPSWFWPWVSKGRCSTFTECAALPGAWGDNILVQGDFTWKRWNPITEQGAIIGTITNLVNGPPKCELGYQETTLYSGPIQQDFDWPGGALYWKLSYRGDYKFLGAPPDLGGYGRALAYLVPASNPAATPTVLVDKQLESGAWITDLGTVPAVPAGTYRIVLASADGRTVEWDDTGVATSDIFTEACDISPMLTPTPSITPTSNTTVTQVGTPTYVTATPNNWWWIPSNTPGPSPTLIPTSTRTPTPNRSPTPTPTPNRFTQTARAEWWATITAWYITRTAEYTPPGATVTPYGTPRPTNTPVPQLTSGLPTNTPVPFDTPGLPKEQPTIGVQPTTVIGGAPRIDPWGLTGGWTWECFYNPSVCMWNPFEPRGTNVPPGNYPPNGPTVTPGGPTLPPGDPNVPDDPNAVPYNPNIPTISPGDMAYCGQCVRPENIDPARWIDYSVCEGKRFVCWGGPQSATAVAIPAMLTKYEPFGTIAEVAQGMSAMRTQVASYAWSSGAVNGVRDPISTSPDALIKPLGQSWGNPWDGGGIVHFSTGGNSLMADGSDGALDLTNSYTAYCGMRLTTYMARRLAEGTCYTLNILRRIGYIPWVQFFINIGCIVLLIRSIRATIGMTVSAVYRDLDTSGQLPGTREDRQRVATAYRRMVAAPKRKRK